MELGQNLSYAIANGFPRWRCVNRRATELKFEIEGLFHISHFGLRELGLRRYFEGFSEGLLG